MNGNRNSRTQNLEKPFPGCLGRMVSLFDLSAGVAGNRLLTYKTYHDGSHSMGRPDAAGMSPIIDPIEDKAMVSELRRSSSDKKSIGTPMKMLIAEEMSKDVEAKHKPLSVVAKLMGLDTLPQQQPDSAMQRSHSRGHSRSHSDIPVDRLQEEDVFNKQMQLENHRCQKQNDNKDVYGIWQQLQKGCYAKELPQKVWHNENISDQKFIEAKRLATDENLRQPRQFQDALEVLCSNRDLFLKYLQEPNSLFSQQSLDLQSVHPPPEIRRITVLRPSKMVNNNQFSGPGKKDEKQIKKASHVGHVVGWDKGNPEFPPPNWQVNNNPTQPTRIVVLKPSPGKPHDIKAVVSPPSSSTRVLHGQEFYGEQEDDEPQESRDVAKEIRGQMHENLSRHRRDETLLSSVFPNGYTGDESSFDKSEIEYAVEKISDTDLVTPTSRHSWDYTNRFGSPYSSCSFSRASCSPESSVCREAKKRLSERWAMMASNGIFQEQRHARRSSSTLGEMLALSDSKNSVWSKEKGRNEEQELMGSTSCSASDLNKDENVDNSPRNLSRSKSLPISSNMFVDCLNVEASNPKVGKTDVPKEATRQQSVKSSLKWKVSSLFFSRTKKSSTAKSSAPRSTDESQKSAGMSRRSPDKIGEDTSQCAIVSGTEEGSLPTLQRSSSKTSTPDLIDLGPKLAVEAGLSETKPLASGNPGENQDQPSPISVLEPLFEEDDNEFSDVNADKHDAKLHARALRSNLIDKSPPIESISRTLSWDDSCLDTATYPLTPTSVSQGTEEQEREWLFFVQSLLAAAGLDGETQSDTCFARWHSPESLLDPSLRDKYIDLNATEIMHEAKRRQMRSTQKLVFDCVNAVLVDITGYGSDTSPWAEPCVAVDNRLLEGGSAVLVDQVWARMKEWFSCEVGGFPGVGGGGDSNSLVVERMVRKEVVGKGWVELRRLEVDNIGKEIEEKLVEELVQEAVIGLGAMRLFFLY